MKQPLFNVNIKDIGFNRKVALASLLAGKSLTQGFRWQGQLLVAELIKRTPPFSGKQLARMLDKQPPNALGSKPRLSDPEIESMNARNVGLRRVAKDFKKVIYGFRGAQVALADLGRAIDWGVMQRCEGKQAIRVFARQDGTVYGVDTANFMPNASADQLVKFVNSKRDKRGRVTNAGQKDRRVGRWRWMDVAVTSEAHRDQAIKEQQKHVGEAKGGWAVSLVELGGNISKGGWVGKHMSSRAGRCKHNLDTAGERIDKISVRIINSSRWAQGKDPDRIREKSIQGRARAMTTWIKKQMELVNKMAGGAALLCLLLSGCATRGGWPCWAWQKNTDQKLERQAKEQLK